MIPPITSTTITPAIAPRRDQDERRACDPMHAMPLQPADDGMATVAMIVAAISGPTIVLAVAEQPDEPREEREETEQEPRGQSEVAQPPRRRE